MDIIISTASDEPKYRQIAQQISAQILRGDLPAGFCLPPIRTAAKELRVSIITVKKAWEELAREGFIDSIVGKGCFVASHRPGRLDSMRFQTARQRLLNDIEYCRSLGLTRQELAELIDELYED